MSEREDDWETWKKWGNDEENYWWGVLKEAEEEEEIKR